MGLVDTFSKEDRTEIMMSKLYTLMREGAKAEIMMNAIQCDVPHKYIREMMTGLKEYPDKKGKTEELPFPETETSK